MLKIFQFVQLVCIQFFFKVLLDFNLIFFVDSNIKDGLYHEFKKYGRITSVRVSGQSNDRYALVFFKKREEAERALNDSKVILTIHVFHI